ncbi:hypothetical protein NLJ89_g7684 [Agrocybe chaxingu]|uniref:Uncharacterized protein n=1 Tax=Agrocybe chaxingu TaxID=84603 RepID=A0A9W8K3X9_9AGAR|nr:hypothetical protein NLJ89_g7684 [Agrocybe chaxingu]
MVAQNPLFSGRWTWKKFGATVLDDIWPEVIVFTLFATIIVLVSENTSANLGVSNQLLTVLGLVLGLVISFRTSSAYERYQDGRKMWTNITIASKNLAQMIWIHVPVDRPVPAGSTEKPMTPLEVMLEKKTMVNLVQAYSVAVKHLLRGEQGVYYEDLYPLTIFPTSLRKRIFWKNGRRRKASGRKTRRSRTNGRHMRTTTEKTMVASSSSSDTGGRGPMPGGPYHRRTRMDTFDPETVLPEIGSDQPLKPARNPPDLTIYDYLPFLRLFRWIWRVVTLQKLNSGETKKKRRKAYAEIVESHIPLEITLVLSNYSAWLMKKGLLQPAIATAVTNTLLVFQDSVSNLERICNTPLPFAYQAHLRMSLWLYLLLLPFQIYLAYGYITIPATAFASFLLLGFLEIGQEIENPFNYDLNDLDLDYFCLSIQRDLHEITAHTTADPSEFLFTRWNQPLAPSDRRNAAELTKDKDKEYRAADGSGESGMGSLRRTLVVGWKEVDLLTRQR